MICIIGYQKRKGFMDEYELDIYCNRHPHCDCHCVKCPAFAAYQRHELGLDEDDEEE